MEKAKAKNIEELLMLLQDLSIDNPHRHIHGDGEIHKVVPQGFSRGGDSGWNAKKHDAAPQMTEEEAGEFSRSMLTDVNVLPPASFRVPLMKANKTILSGEQERMITLVAQIARIENTDEGAAEAKKLLAELKSLLPEDN